jgi:hypothetical protein
VVATGDRTELGRISVHLRLEPRTQREPAEAETASGFGCSNSATPQTGDRGRRNGRNTCVVRHLPCHVWPGGLRSMTELDLGEATMPPKSSASTPATRSPPQSPTAPPQSPTAPVVYQTLNLGCRGHAGLGRADPGHGYSGDGPG